MVLAPHLDNKFMALETADGSRLMTWPLKRMLRIHSVGNLALAACHLLTSITPPHGSLHMNCQTKPRSVLHPGHLCHADAMPARCFVHPV